MSRESVEAVRRFNDPHEGTDTMALIRDALANFGPDPDPRVVLSWWEQDPGWRHVHPEVEWDTTAVPGLGTRVKGPIEVTEWWREWTDAWQSYVYRTIEYRDVGDSVFTATAIEASGPGGIPVEMTVFQLWRVRDGKVAACRVFMSESDALEAVTASD